MSRRNVEAHLALDVLEDRFVPASISLSSGVLVVKGDAGHNTATVTESSQGFAVHVESTPVGSPFGPTILDKYYAKSKFTVNSIKFTGYEGNDYFYGKTSKPISATGDAGLDTLIGGKGNDTLKGGTSNDAIYGGGGSDKLYGGGGNDLVYGGSGGDTLYGDSDHDSLYGNSGADTLYGGSGNDGVYGGSDVDKLYGGTGNDRFLVLTGQTEHKDAQSWDAVVYFKGSWSASHIEWIDEGLRILHQRTGTDNLLETASGKAVTIVRRGANDGARADNNSVGTINAYEGMFASKGIAAKVIIHEMAHNWDREHSGWSRWLGYNSWSTTFSSGKVRSGDGEWWYDGRYTAPSATFPRTYSTHNPMEDFASAWESYFIYRYGMENPENILRLSTLKTSHLDGLFGALS